MRGGHSTSGHCLGVSPRRVRRSDVASESHGFTVIEVLIVLGITGLLFVSAAVMIAGRQNRTAFEQAVRNVHSQIQAAIDEVVVGHYPNSGDFQCNASGSGPVITDGSNEQGTNGGCIFMGRVIQFGVADSDPEQFKLYTVAGLRTVASGDEVQSRTEAQPVLVAPSATQPNMPDGTVTEMLENGLTTSFAEYGSGNTPVAGIVIWQSLAALSGGTLSSGGQAASISPLTGASLGMSQAQFVNAANASIATDPLDDDTGVRLCFVSASTEQSGLVTIGGNRRPLNVTLDIKSNRTCG